MNHIRPVLRKLALTAGMLLLASTTVTPAMATSVTFNFTGNLTSIDRLDNVGNTVVGTTTFTPPSIFTGGLGGSFTFNSDPSPGTAFPFAVYSNHVTSLNFHQGSYNNTAGPINPNFIGVLNDFTAIHIDAYSTSMPFSGSSVNGLINGITPVTFNPLAFEIDVIGQGMFNNNSLPNVPPSLTFNDAKYRVIFAYGNSGDTLVLNGTLATLTAVPLPPAMILFGAGLVALIGLGARNWQLKGSEIA